MTQLLFVLLCGDRSKKYTTLYVCSSDFKVSIVSHLLCLNLKVFSLVSYSGLQINSG